MNSLLYKTSLKREDLIIQKSDNGNSLVNVDREDYIKKTDDILSHQKMFFIVNFNWLNLRDTLLCFSVNQEKHIEKVLKKNVESNIITKKTRWQTRCYGQFIQVHKDRMGDCPLYRPTLSVLNTPTYKLPKFLDSQF